MVTKATKVRKPRKRSAGRPFESGTVGTGAIIEAAVQLLRDRSPLELTVVEVAQQANVDPALIRYYFGNKKGLLRAATEHLMEEVQERSRIMLTEKVPLKERVRKRLSLLLAVLQENPRFFQLVMEEIYKDEDGERGRDGLRSVANRGLALSEALLEPVAGDPALRAVDARLLHVAILGMCTFFMDAKPLLTILFEDEAGEDAYTEQYLDFATGLLVRGLAA
ncbi:TetR/AcrR family transcriptional regulator [Cupriavidus oxalaticus]|uniref:TetR/AcrR family transcriptional regulator n=1 Tax=Cupriavidus oxalaticus TaxID=96344 RepID=UPI0011C165C3|nr:TetR/AcrR family transcriptional regulator [Cupriavidus oxalaticus]WQD84511.1 TetR/AcrR family transcriptional regulator [Cupriavidus oxalaticus]